MSILHELQHLRKIWWNQDFCFSEEQQKQYDELLKQRRQQVRSYYENGQVFKGRSSIE